MRLTVVIAVLAPLLLAGASLVAQSGPSTDSVRQLVERNDPEIRAQRRAIADTRSAHPSHWAAFALIGASR